MCPTFSEHCRVLKLRCLAFLGGLGGFREVREAGRNHFHLYLLVSVVTSYDQKPWGELFRSSPVCVKNENVCYRLYIRPPKQSIVFNMVQ